MKTFVFAAVLLALSTIATPALAQNAPTVEVFGGYSALVDEAAIHGWHASLAVNPSAHIGLVADVATQYGDPVRFHQFLFGPRFNGRGGRVNPFAHALIGFEKTSGGGTSLEDTHLAFGLGAGLDVRISGPVSLRPIQFDWIPIKTSGWHTSTLRFGVGVVIGFGG